MHQAISPQILTLHKLYLNLRHRHNLSLTRPAVSSRAGYPNSSERRISSLGEPVICSAFEQLGLASLIHLIKLVFSLPTFPLKKKKETILK